MSLELDQRDLDPGIATYRLTDHTAQASDVPPCTSVSLSVKQGEKETLPARINGVTYYA